MSNILVQNIKHTNGTTSMVVDSSGHVATDTIKGNSTAGSISVVGEGNSTTTNLQQGLAKVWAHSAENGASLDDNFNASSITDLATGKQQIDIANNMSNANYSVLCSYIDNQTDLTHWCDGLTTAKWQQNAYHSGAYIDRAFASVAFGDLA